jgi:hypothetical protein
MGALVILGWALLAGRRHLARLQSFTRDLPRGGRGVRGKAACQHDRQCKVRRSHRAARSGRPPSCWDCGSMGCQPLGAQYAGRCGGLAQRQASTERGRRLPDQDHRRGARRVLSDSAVDQVSRWRHRRRYRADCVLAAHGRVRPHWGHARTRIFLLLWDRRERQGHVHQHYHWMRRRISPCRCDRDVHPHKLEPASDGAGQPARRASRHRH